MYGAPQPTTPHCRSNGLSLSPTACRNERKGPSNWRGAEYACPDRRRPYLETRSGERLASHGESKLRKPPSLDQRAAVSMVTPGPSVGGFRSCFFLETRRQNACLASAVASPSHFGRRLVGVLVLRAPFAFVVPFVGLGMRAWTPEIGTQDHIMHQPNRSGSKLSIAQRPVHHTRRSDSSSGA